MLTGAGCSTRCPGSRSVPLVYIPPRYKVPSLSMCARVTESQAEPPNVHAGRTSRAFPSISTGVFSYPLNRAAHVALGTVRDFLESNPQVELVRFVLFGRDAYDAHVRALQDVMRGED